MNTEPSGMVDMRQSMRRWGLWVIILFWVLQFSELTISSFYEDGVAARGAILPRIFVSLLGLALTWMLVEVAARALNRPFRKRLWIVTTSTLVAFIILVTVNLAVFYYFYLRQLVTFHLGSYFMTAFAWSWFFFSIGCTLLALSVSLDVRERERRVADLQRIASEAQMMALRHQLNPHFLFNTLNSIAALIDARENSVAEEMVENLSDFLRATLELDPIVDVTLSREIELQELYLEIESVRFPDRLDVRYDIPGKLADVHVPALITQPLVENAIHHGVARSSDPVLVTISAQDLGEQVVIIVENDVSTSARPRSRPNGVGLANVRARLERRFGNEQRVEVLALHDRFRVALTFPKIVTA